MDKLGYKIRFYCSNYPCGLIVLGCISYEALTASRPPFRCCDLKSVFVLRMFYFCCYSNCLKVQSLIWIFYIFCSIQHISSQGRWPARSLCVCAERYLVLIRNPGSGSVNRKQIKWLGANLSTLIQYLFNVVHVCMSFLCALRFPLIFRHYVAA